MIHAIPSGLYVFPETGQSTRNKAQAYKTGLSVLQSQTNANIYTPPNFLNFNLSIFKELSSFFIASSWFCVSCSQNLFRPLVSDQFKVIKSGFPPSVTVRHWQNTILSYRHRIVLQNIPYPRDPKTCFDNLIRIHLCTLS